MVEVWNHVPDDPFLSLADVQLLEKMGGLHSMANANRRTPRAFREGTSAAMRETPGTDREGTPGAKRERGQEAVLPNVNSGIN